MSLASGLSGLARGLAGGFGSRQVGGDPTALTVSNADARFTALGLTQAGTGTTWGETGQAATPLYAVAAAKVPLAVETIGGKKYFGPIVNPAGTNLALYSNDGTNAAWVKTGCTAALALGGLEHDADWRGSDVAVNGGFDTDSDWAKATGVSITDGTANFVAVQSASALYQGTGVSGKFYILTYSITEYTGGSIRAVAFDNAQLGTDRSAVGTYTELVFVGTNVNIGFRADITFTGKIDNFSAVEVDAHTLITATGNNATALQSITSTSGERVTKWWVSTDDTGVFVSHGAPTGSALYEDAFGSDTSGEWNGKDTTDGVLSVSAGTLTHTGGAGDGAYPRYIRVISGITIGKRYRASIIGLAGTAPLCAITNDTTNGFNGESTQAAGNSYLYIQATGTSLAFVLQVQSATPSGLTASVDELLLEEVAETELTPGANPVPVDLAAYTGANPQLGTRIGTSGDSVRLYGVQHQVAARALRPRIGPTAGSSVTTGARKLYKTGILAPDAIDVEFVFEFGKTFYRYFVFGAEFTRGISCNVQTGTSLYVYWWHDVDGYKSIEITGLTAGELYKIRIEAESGVLFRVTVNGVSETGTANSSILNTSGPLYIGSSATDQEAGSPILAFRDNLGTILPAPYGWNTRLLDNWS